MPFPICVHRFDSSQRNEKTKVEESPNLLWKEVIESVILDGIKCGEE